MDPQNMTTFAREMERENTDLREHIQALNAQWERVAQALGFTRCACGDEHCGAWFPPGLDDPCMLSTDDLLAVVERVKDGKRDAKGFPGILNPPTNWPVEARISHRILLYAAQRAPHTMNQLTIEDIVKEEIAKESNTQGEPAATDKAKQERTSK
jgi:hypothetical protein